MGNPIKGHHRRHITLPLIIPPLFLLNIVLYLPPYLPQYLWILKLLKNPQIHHIQTLLLRHHYILLTSFKSIQSLHSQSVVYLRHLRLFWLKRLHYVQYWVLVLSLLVQELCLLYHELWVLVVHEVSEMLLYPVSLLLWNRLAYCLYIVFFTLQNTHFTRSLCIHWRNLTCPWSLMPWAKIACANCRLSSPHPCESIFNIK